jgi:hypothetical protein
VRPGGPVGLLAFVAHGPIPGDQIEGNHFPTPDRLAELLASASLTVEHSLSTADLPEIPRDWNERVEAVTNALGDRHGRTKAWQLAERQSSTIGELLADGTLTGELMVLRRG